MPREDLLRGSSRLIVHELRGAVTIIKGYASLLREDELSEESRRYAIDLIGRRALDLGTLLDSLRASLAGAQDEADMEAIDARQVAMAAIEHIEPRARLEGAVVTPVGLSGRPVMVLAARVDLLHVLHILLENALAYSPRPARVEIEVQDVEGRHAEITVRDHGLGIAPDLSERIFESGFRLYTSIDGFGLGLAISRELAERNGGSLRLEWSKPGEGSVFVLSVPRAQT